MTTQTTTDNIVNNPSAPTPSADDISSVTLINTQRMIEQSKSIHSEYISVISSLETRHSLLQRLDYRPSTSIRRTLQQQFLDYYNAPISKPHERYFAEYFKKDSGVETCTVDEFCNFFQVGPTFGKRLLMIFNMNEAANSNSIPRASIIRMARLLWSVPMSIKTLILFKVFDADDNDRVSVSEIRLFYEDYLKDLRIFKDQRRAKEAVNTFLRGFFPTANDIHYEQELNFDQFYEIIQQNPDVFKSLNLIGIPDQKYEDENKMSCYQRSLQYMRNNKNRVIVLILYFLTLTALITYRAISLREYTPWQIMARIGGISINFNFAVAIILMLKQTMTIIRRIYFLRRLIPVDDHIDGHRLVGTIIFISAIVHIFGYVVQFAVYTETNSWAASMFTTAAGLGWVYNSGPITGDILFVYLAVMFICSLQCIRQRPGFTRLFYYSHLLFWPIFILLVIHSKEFWKWTVGPMSLFVLEKIYLLKRHLPKYGRTYLKTVRIEDDNALTLIIERPKYFTFRIGEYINVCLPNIARMEWHPFTISSGPEQEDIRVTILKKKNWTKKVYDHFYTRITDPDNTTELREVTTDTSNARKITLPAKLKLTHNDRDATVCIEGPFSTCTSYIFDCEHVVLIGAGIGITPAISALESLIYQLRAVKFNCADCNAVNHVRPRVGNQKLKKVDFVWVNRDIGNFCWFQNLLSKFEKEQDEYLGAASSHTNSSREQPSRYLDIHLYCTSLKSNEQVMLDNVPYNIMADMFAVKHQQDMHTMLRTPTQVGRPRWTEFFSKFKDEHQTTNVFFTGDAKMGVVIKRYCDELRFPFKHEPYF